MIKEPLDLVTDLMCNLIRCQTSGLGANLATFHAFCTRSILFQVVKDWARHESGLKCFFIHSKVWIIMAFVDVLLTQRLLCDLPQQDFFLQWQQTDWMWNKLRHLWLFLFFKKKPPWAIRHLFWKWMFRSLWTFSLICCKRKGKGFVVGCYVMVLLLQPSWDQISLCLNHNLKWLYGTCIVLMFSKQT